jgi:Secretion system C-terminal sorting domain/Beta-propeller repeat
MKSKIHYPNICELAMQLQIKKINSINKKTLLLIGYFLTLITNAQQPTFEWAKKFGNTNTGYENCFAVATDNSGNIYSTGYFSGISDFDPGVGVTNLTSSLYGDMFITKMDPSGNLVWVKQIAGNGTEIGYSIFIDNSGSIYTSGNFNGICDFDPGAGIYNLTTTTLTGSFILKLNASGGFEWAHNTGQTQGDYRSFVTVDNTGNAFITCSITSPFDFDPTANEFILNPGPNPAAFITKFSSNGNYVWTKMFNIPTGAQQYSTPVSITSLATDADGNVIAAGEFDQTVDFNPGTAVDNLTTLGNKDSVILKLNASGDFVWVKQFGGIALNRTQTIAVDTSGNVYTAGRFEFETDFDPGVGVFNLSPYDPQNYGGIFISKLNASGEFVWAKNFGYWNVTDEVNLVLDANRNIYVAGEFSGNFDFDPTSASFLLTGNNDNFVAKYSNDGNLNWAVKFGGSNIDLAKSLTVDSVGNVYTVGSFYGTSDFDQTSGTFEMTAIGSNNTDAYVHKMSQQTLGLQLITNLENIINIYPNPANSQINLSFENILENANINISSLLGQTVLEKQNIFGNNIALNIQNLSRGIYVIEVTNGKLKFNSKFVKQ